MLLALALAVAPASVPASPDPLTVPGDFDTLQAALDAAPPGARILVNGGEHPPVVVRRPVTIVAEPRATISYQTQCDPQVPAVTLRGAGHGVVTLVDLDLRATLGNCTSTLQGGATLAGEGFRELRIRRCDIEAPYLEPDGQAPGFAGISTSVPVVIVSRSRVTGGDANHDYYCYGNTHPNAAPAIDAPTSHVILVDSFVAGGSSWPVCGKQNGACPSSGAEGGAGVVVAKLTPVGTVLRGGAGGTYHLYGPNNSYGALCGKAPDGPDAIVLGPAPLSAVLPLPAEVRAALGL